jgi:thiol-disulfide isomerase/thioredoxin
MTLSLLVCAVLTAPGDSELLHFTAPWCEACRRSEPAVARLESDGFPVRHINVDERPDVARQYNVQALPSFLLVSRGRVLRRTVGAVSYEQLVSFVRSSTSVRGPESDTDSRSPAEAAPRMVPETRQAPSNSPTPAEQRALQATVRLRIEDRAGQSYGTGTIIDLHGDECLVLTCGHVFRDSQGKGRIVAELFTGGQNLPVEGKLLRYDLDNDLALIVIRPGVRVESVRVSGPSRQTAPGDQVFTVGCNHGHDPTVMRGRVNAINKYVGPPANIVVSGKPQDGRSGGGLFSSDGELIGVCQAADPEYNEGLYAHLPAIHQYLDRANLAFVYEPSRSLASAANVQPALSQEGRGAVLPRLDLDNQLSPTSNSSHTALGDLASNDATEVVCIVRSKANPSAKSQVVVLDRPSREFLSQLTHEQTRQDKRQVTDLRVRQRRPTTK